MGGLYSSYLAARHENYHGAVMVAPSYGLDKPEQISQLQDLIANSPADKLLSMVPGSK